MFLLSRQHGLEIGKRRMRGDTGARVGTASTIAGFQLPLMFVIVAVKAEQFPIAAVGRIVVVIVVAVMDSQFTNVDLGKFAGAPAADPWIDLQGPLAVALFALFGGTTGVGDDTVKLAGII
jgi:hypothetical protein